MSTVKVDTIQTTGGVSEIAIDKLKGVSSASSISVVGEGGSTTTNLQQGLAKTWTCYSGAGVDGTADMTGNRDSFNVTSLVDGGTGLYTTNMTNVFSNNDYAFTYCGAQSGAETTYQMGTADAGITSHQIQLKNAAGTVTDRNYVCGAFHGDLA